MRKPFVTGMILGLAASLLAAILLLFISPTPSPNLSETLDQTPEIDLDSANETYFSDTAHHAGSNPFHPSSYLSLVLDTGDHIVYWQLPDSNSIKRTTLEGLRAVLITFLQTPDRLHLSTCEETEPRFPCWDAIVFVKTHARTPFSQLVNTLDEFAIQGIKKFSVVQWTPTDSLRISQAPFK